MRRLASFIVSIFILTVLSFWVAGRYQSSWEPMLRSRIESEGKKILGAPVHVRRIELLFPHRVRLHDVSVEPYFEARHITLVIDFFDIVPALVRRKPVESFGIVRIQDPHIHLTAQQIQIWKHRPQTVRSRKKTLPLFFSVTWDNGTFDYADWSVSGLQGAYRLRGPQQSFALRAESPVANSIRFQFSTLRNRWNAQAYVRDANLARLIQLIEQTTAWKMPASWAADGTMSVEAHAEGREKPVPTRWTHYLKKADVTLRQGHLTIGQTPMPLAVQATLRGQQDALVMDKASLTVADNVWNVGGQLSGFGTSLEASIEARLPTGHLARRTITDTLLQMRYEKRLWTLTEGHANWGSGHVQATGLFTPKDMELRVTGTDLPLSELLSVEKKTPVTGRMNLAAVLDGPYKEWQLRGSWWMDDLRWNRKRMTAQWRGSLESQPSGAFSLRGDTTDAQYHITTQGQLHAPRFTIQNLQLNMPGGEIFTGQADGSFQTQTGTFTVKTDRWMWGKQTFEGVVIESQWALDFMAVDVRGQHRWTTDAPLAPFSTQFTWKPTAIDIQHLDYQLAQAALSATGRVHLGHPILAIDASGTLSDPQANPSWSIPLTAQGTLRPQEQWQGQAFVKTSSVTARDQTYSPIETQVTWSLEGLQWKELRYGNGQWTSEGQWRWAPDSPLCQADFTVNQASLDRWMPSSSTVSGVAHLTNLCRDLDTQGTFGTQGQFSFKMQSAPGAASGFPFRWVIREGTVRTEETRVSIRPGAIVDFPEKKSATLQAGLEVRNFRAGIFTLFGNFDLDAAWSGQSGAPIIDAKARTRSLFINDYELEEGRILAHYENGVIRFLPPPAPPTLVSGAIDIRQKPQLVFDHFVVTGKERQKLDLHGQAGPGLWDFVMTGQRMDLGVLGELAGFVAPMSGTADITARGTGDLKHPHLDGSARIQNGKVSLLRFSEGDAEFLWQDNRITFRKLRLKDHDRYTALGSGVFPLRARQGDSPPEQINFSVRLENTTLGVLQSAFPEIRKASGKVEGLVQIQGTWEDPKMTGRIRIEDGDLTNAHYFRRLKNIQMLADLEGNALKVKELHGRSGKGEISASGEFRLSGLEFTSYDLEARVTSKEGIELQVPELAIPDSPLAKKFKFLTSTSRCIVKGNAQLQGPADAPTFRGDIELSNGHFTFPPSAKKPAPPAWTQWLNRTYWDIVLKFREGLWYENELVQANLTGKIHIKGNGDQLLADGETVIPQGRISYLGLQFDIREARFDLKNNIPYLRGLADTKIEATDTVGLSPTSNPSQRYNIEDTITLTIDYAPLDQIRPRLTSASNPSLSQEKMLTRITRLETENLSAEERNYLYQRQVVSLIDNSLATPFAQNVLKRTGLVDRVRVQHVFDPSAAPVSDPANPDKRSTTAGYDILANTKYTVEKNLLNNLSVGYGVRFIPTVSAETNKKTLDLVSDVQMSYQAFKNVYLRGAFDLPNANNPAFIPEKRVTIEPRWRFGWWGNTNKDKIKKDQEKQK